MKRKALKNIPKPDEEKLALFYGKKAVPAETAKREPEMSTVVNENLLRDKLKLLITPGQQAVYLSLYKRAPGSGKDTTDWIGYGELAKETGISLKTVQRAVDRLINASLIKRIDLTNTAEIKGSQYQVILPEGMSTVDKKTTVDKMSTVVNKPKTDVVF